MTAPAGGAAQRSSRRRPHGGWRQRMQWSACTSSSRPPPPSAPAAWPPPGEFLLCHRAFPFKSSPFRESGRDGAHAPLSVLRHHSRHRQHGHIPVSSLFPHHRAFPFTKVDVMVTASYSRPPAPEACPRPGAHACLPMVLPSNSTVRHDVMRTRCQLAVGGAHGHGSGPPPLSAAAPASRTTPGLSNQSCQNYVSAVTSCCSCQNPNKSTLYVSQLHFSSGVQRAGAQGRGKAGGCPLDGAGRRGTCGGPGPRARHRVQQPGRLLRQVCSTATAV